VNPRPSTISARQVGGLPGTALSARQVSAIIGILSPAMFMASLDLFIVNLAFPYIGIDFRGASLSSLSWVLNGYTIVFAAVLVPAGRWADRVGRRRVFMAGLAAFSVSSVLCGLAPGVAVLIAARVIQAVGAGLMVPASLSVLLATVPASALSHAIGTWAAFAALGAALGPVIGGSLVQFSWRWVFWINLPVGLAAIVLAGRMVPESKDEHVAGRPDLIGAGLLAAAVGLIALALVKAPDWGWGSARFLGVLLASLACAAAMLARSHRLLGAGSASLPADRFGTGSGILNMARQVGTVLGVASLIAVLTDVAAGDPVTAFRRGVVLIIGFVAAATIVSAGLLTGRSSPMAAPALAVAEEA
jgi:MFS family permease